MGADLLVGSGADVTAFLAGRRGAVTSLVRDAYLAHGRGEDVVPHSQFLRFPGRPADRIIALPAYVGGANPLAAMKRISSVPGNVARGIPRASAAILLNDPDSGRVVGCLEGSAISAARTGGSAVVSAGALCGSRHARRLAVVGAGPIARETVLCFREVGWEFDEVAVHDLHREAAAAFAQDLGERTGYRISAVEDLQDLLGSADLILFATSAGVPHVLDPAVFAHHPVVLHLSLRDLGTDVVVASQNITDDVDHVLRERTSLHLAEIDRGDRSFIDGTIAEVLEGTVRRDPDRTCVFSPFGLGALDAVVARWVLEGLVAQGAGTTVRDFHLAGVAS